MPVKPEYMDISLVDLFPAPWNYKTDDPALSAKLKSNMERNGQVESLIVRELAPDPEKPVQRGRRFEVVNGNHRLGIMIDLGLQTAHCCNLGPITDAMAQRVAIETNETRFASDEMKLAELIRGIAVEFSVDDLAITLPFSGGDMEEMIALSNLKLKPGETSDDLFAFNPPPPGAEPGRTTTTMSPERGGGAGATLNGDGGGDDRASEGPALEIRPKERPAPVQGDETLFVVRFKSDDPRVIALGDLLDGFTEITDAGISVDPGVFFKAMKNNFD